jgi:hypothetical protein
VEQQRIMQFRRLHRRYLGAKFSFLLLVNMLQMAQRDKRHGHSLEEINHLNGI